MIDQQRLPGVSSAVTKDSGGSGHARERAWRRMIPVVLLLLLASYMRLAHLDLVQYREDDDALWNIVMRMFRTGVVPLTGMHSSIGLPNGPFQVLLLAPFGWVGASPPIMTGAVGLMNVLAVACVYGFTRDFFGCRAALFALLLVAANPWAVVLSRRLWGDDTVAPFAVLTLWMLSRWVTRDSHRAVIVAAGALAIVTQVYIVGLACLVTAAVAVLLVGRRLLTRSVVVALALFCAMMAPYLVGAALPRISAIRNIAVQPGKSQMFDVVSAKFALELASNEGYQTFALQGGGRLDATSGIPGALGMGARGLYGLGLCIGLWTLVRGRGAVRTGTRAVHVLLFVSIVAPVVALFRHAVPIYPYYLIATFPAPYLYGGIALDTVWSWAEHVRRSVRAAVHTAVVTSVSSLLVVQCLLASVFFSVSGEYWPTADYGMPWRMTDQLVHVARELQHEHGAARVLVGGHTEEASVLSRVLAASERGDGLMDDRKIVVLPERPTIALYLGDDRAQQYLASHRAPVREQLLAGKRETARFFVLGSERDLVPMDATPLGWKAADLARLDSVQIPDRVQRGQVVPIAIMTTVLVRPDPSVPDFSVFAHLVNHEGQAVAQRDDAMWRSALWQAGDHMVQWLDIPVPADAPSGVLDAVLGMYSTGTPDRPRVTPLELTDARGNRLGGSARGAVTVIPPATPPPPATALHVQFAGGIQLEGYDLQSRRDALTVTPHWYASEPVPRDYTVFVHIVDASGKVVAQNDSQPLSGQFPTSLWREGDHIADAHAIALPPGLRAGEYRIAFGLYELQSLKRLDVQSGQPEAMVRLPG